MKRVLTGLASGVVIAWLAVASLRSLVFEVETRDPAAIGATTALMVAVAAIAIYLPARRATAVDPVEALTAG